MNNIVATLLDTADKYECCVYAITAYNVRGTVKVSLQSRYNTVVKGSISESATRQEVVIWCRDLLVQYKQIDKPF